MMFSDSDLVWAARECERQKTGLQGLVRMLKALDHARKRAASNWFMIEPRSDLPTITDAMDLARIIEPRNEFYSFASSTEELPAMVSNYRRTPVTFANGGGSCPWDMISDAVVRWWDTSGAAHREMDRGDCTEFVRGLMVIHPWEDGNGRVAALLFNWLLHGFKGDLEALPDLGFSEQRGR